MKQAQSPLAAVIYLELSDLNTSGQRYQQMENCVTKLLHALTQSGLSGVPQLVFFVINVSTNVSNLKFTALYDPECWLTMKGN